MKIYNTASLLILSLSTVAQASLMEDLGQCNSTEKTDYKKVLCKTEKISHKMMQDHSKDNRHYILLAGCSVASKIPEMYLNGWIGFKSLFKDGGMGENFELRNQCLDQGAKYIDAHLDQTYSLPQQVSLLRTVCNSIMNANDKKEMNLERMYNCYTETFSPTNKSALTDLIDRTSQECNTLVGLLKGNDAESYLSARSQCLDLQLKNYVETGANISSVDNSSRNNLKPLSPTKPESANGSKSSVRNK